MDVKVEEMNQVADGGDYLKIVACTAVMLQSVLGLAWDLPRVVALRPVLAGFYLAVKFTAPAFICGILFTTMRTTATHQPGYGAYLKRQWSALFFPTICWTLAYLVIFPGLQQHHPYHNRLSFGWQFINGNAAPHLWYNTMMLQMIFLMPLFWAIRRGSRTRRMAHWILGLTVLGYLLWLGWYDWSVYPTSRVTRWYLLDRICLGFFPYAILGIAAWDNWAIWQRRLRRCWPVLLGLAVVALIGQWRTLMAWALPISLDRTSYYLPATVGYVLAVIGLVLAVAGWQQAHRSRWLPVIHRLAGMAYPSYLANVFWLQVIWRLGGAALTRSQPVIGIGVCYLLTWGWSFGFTAVLTKVIKWRKRQ